jgi:hypothetical protein
MKTSARVYVAGAILFAFIARTNLSAQTAPKPPEPSPLNQISWLTGGTWVAEVKDNQGTSTRIENRIRWSENGQLIKFITTFISHNKPEVHYEGIYAWDPAKKQISFWYTDQDGNLTQGTAAMAGETLTQEFDIMHLNGRTDKLRSLIVRDTPDSYQWNVSGPKDGKWAELLHLRYIRESK